MHETQFNVPITRYYCIFSGIVSGNSGSFTYTGITGARPRTITITAVSTDGQQVTLVRGVRSGEVKWVGTSQIFIQCTKLKKLWICTDVLEPRLSIKDSHKACVQLQVPPTNIWKFNSEKKVTSNFYSCLTSSTVSIALPILISMPRSFSGCYYTVKSGLSSLLQ